jgi:hypothetical protein
MLYLSELAGAVPFVVTVSVVVVVATTIGCFPTTMPASAGVTLHDGAAAQVPLNVTTHPDAGTPLAPIVTVIALSVPATAGEVPQFDEHVGAVVCVVAICVAPVPVPWSRTFAAVERKRGVTTDVFPVAVVNVPAFGVVAPMVTLSIALAVAGLIVTVPVPVGEATTF